MSGFTWKRKRRAKTASLSIFSLDDEEDEEEEGKGGMVSAVLLVMEANLVVWRQIHFVLKSHPGNQYHVSFLETASQPLEYRIRSKLQHDTMLCSM